MTRWFNQSFSEEQQVWIVLCIVMLSVIGACVLCWISDVYRLLPGWGPIRKFDSNGHEDLRVNQALLHQHIGSLQAAQTRPPEEQRSYGAIGPPTWGMCESSDLREQAFIHPVYGEVKIREGFAETQRMREQCEWWAKDEPHFIAQNGLRPPAVRINGYYSLHSGRMV
mmetsp:Transcript_138372/g.385972  ORF Transcript_138372/g.385972 Transcript_138372/m.385972 type:complete len:168 (-) Transcript_138372:73-576(-)